MTQRQEFKTLKKYDGFELREYLPCSLAEVRVTGDLSLAGSLAFRPLFQYISKGNKQSEKISMTSPVITSLQSKGKANDQWYVSFVMPGGITISQLPDPNDPRVFLRQVEAELCVATSYRGQINENVANELEMKLRALAAKEKISLSPETRICRFDPPVKPGFLQYNEIVIPVQVIPV